MATPLAQLLDAVLFDGGVREQFRLSPEAFLRSAGYDDLDATDVQEALFVLAEGSASVRASQLVAGGLAIGDPIDLDSLDGPAGEPGAESGGLGAAGDSLVTALDAINSEETTLDDPEALDDIDNARAIESAHVADSNLDAAFGAGTADADTSDTDTSDLAVDGQELDASVGAESDAEELDEPHRLTADVSPELDDLDPFDVLDPLNPLDPETDPDPSDDWTDFET